MPRRSKTDRPEPFKPGDYPEIGLKIVERLSDREKGTYYADTWQYLVIHHCCKELNAPPGQERAVLIHKSIAKRWKDLEKDTERVFLCNKCGLALRGHRPQRKKRTPVNTFQYDSPGPTWPVPASVRGTKN